MPAAGCCHKRGMSHSTRQFPKAPFSGKRKQFAGLGVKDALSAELLELLGADAFAALTERFGGRRVFVPKEKLDTAISAVLGQDAAQVLSSHYGGTYLRVPLARAFRAKRYRIAGQSNGWIATKLGLTETAVDKIFAALAARSND
jgi:hypothetical protein